MVPCRYYTLSHNSVNIGCGWIDSLQKRLAEKKVRGLDFYRLDVNWAVFTAFNRGSWLEVKKLEQFCRRRKFPRREP